MSRALFLITLVVLLSSCKITAPTFKNLGTWSIGEVQGGKVTIHNTAYFYNPNDIDGIKVNTVSVAVMTNGKKLGTITNTAGKLTIPKKSDFSIPLSLEINPSELVGSLTDILGAALGKSIDLRCVGNVGVGYSVINKNISIDQTVPIKVSDIKF